MILARFDQSIPNHAEDAMTSSTTQSRQFIEDYLHALSGQPKTDDLVARFVSDPTLVEHIRQVEAAFPEYELIANQLIAEENLVAMRGTFRGVHQGTFAGIEPTHEAVSADLMIFYRLGGGRIVEHWLQMDMAVVVAQLTRCADLHLGLELQSQASA
jgi:predicted ester cyclase